MKTVLIIRNYVSFYLFFLLYFVLYNKNGEESFQYMDVELFFYCQLWQARKLGFRSEILTLHILFSIFWKSFRSDNFYAILKQTFRRKISKNLTIQETPEKLWGMRGAFHPWKNMLLIQILVENVYTHNSFYVEWFFQALLNGTQELMFLLCLFIWRGMKNWPCSYGVSFLIFN